MRASFTFDVCRAVSSYTFDCPSCGKIRRKRTFKAEMTVNPFNVRDDGTPKDKRDVYADARAEVVREIDRFKREPLCFACEEALSYDDRAALRQRRVLRK